MRDEFEKIEKEIIDHKRLDKALQKARDELEIRVKEHTAEPPDLKISVRPSDMPVKPCTLIRKSIKFGHTYW